MNSNRLKIAQSIESYVAIPDETDFLVKYAEMAKYGLIEIGSWKGRSTIFLADMAEKKSIPIIAIDTWLDCDIPGMKGKNFYPEFFSNIYDCDFKCPFLSIGKKSENVAREFEIIKRNSKLAKYLNKFDFLFIDGDHSYNSVKQDFELWLPHLERPAYVVFHDINWGEVKKFYKEIGERYEHHENGAYSNIGVVILPENQSGKLFSEPVGENPMI